MKWSGWSLPANDDGSAAVLGPEGKPVVVSGTADENEFVTETPVNASVATCIVRQPAHDLHFLRIGPLKMVSGRWATVGRLPSGKFHAWPPAGLVTSTYMAATDVAGVPLPTPPLHYHHLLWSHFGYPNEQCIQATPLVANFTPYMQSTWGNQGDAGCPNAHAAGVSYARGEAGEAKLGLDCLVRDFPAGYDVHLRRPDDGTIMDDTDFIINDLNAAGTGDAYDAYIEYAVRVLSASPEASPPPPPIKLVYTKW